MEIAEGGPLELESAGMKTKSPKTRAINIVTAAILKAGLSLGAKKRGEDLLAECVGLVAADLGLGRTAPYNWIKNGHMQNVDFGQVTRLAKLAGIPVEHLSGVEPESSDTNGSESDR